MHFLLGLGIEESKNASVEKKPGVLLIGKGKLKYEDTIGVSLSP